jgi:hypothetical protein
MSFAESLRAKKFNSMPRKLIPTTVSVRREESPPLLQSDGRPRSLRSLDGRRSLRPYRPARPGAALGIAKAGRDAGGQYATASLHRSLLTLAQAGRAPGPRRRPRVRCLRVRGRRSRFTKKSRGNSVTARTPVAPITRNVVATRRVLAGIRRDVHRPSLHPCSEA